MLTIMPHAGAAAEQVMKERRPAQTAIGARLAARASSPKQQQVQFDAAVTMIRPRVDLTDEAEDLVLAAGTPRFHEDEAIVELHEEAASSTRPFAVVRMPLPAPPTVNGVTIPFDKLMISDDDDDLTRPVLKGDHDDLAFAPAPTLIDPLLANLKIKGN
ncbi:MAG: hypothetical protein WKG01_14120 [Kofleriaceae bacterium]